MEHKRRGHPEGWPQVTLTTWNRDAAQRSLTSLAAILRPGAW